MFTISKPITTTIIATVVMKVIVDLPITSLVGINSTDSNIIKPIEFLIYCYLPVIYPRYDSEFATIIQI